MKKVYRLLPPHDVVECSDWPTDSFEEDEVWLASSGRYYTIAIDELTAWMKIQKWREQNPQ